MASRQSFKLKQKVGTNTDQHNKILCFHAALKLRKGFQTFDRTRSLLSANLEIWSVG